jgi:AraC family transcriptional regulator, arabinose operon regulatory protein
MICMDNSLILVYQRRMDRRKRPEGFPGQRIVVLPRKVVARALEPVLLRGLLPTDAGYFPKAAGHYMERKTGANQAIFIYCTHGRGWCELNGQRHEVQAGDLLVVPPETPHVYGADETHPWTISWVHAAGANVGFFLNELGVSVEHPVIYLGEDPQLLGLFEEVLAMLEHGYAPGQLLYASLALAHLVGVMIWHRQQKWRVEPDPKQKINQSIAYMKQHLEKPLQVSTLAALANLSPSYYTALFKQHTGYAPIDYFIRLRMHSACQSLDTTNLPVKKIAAALGYDDPFYFSRLFKTVNETSPTQYRLMHKG